MRSDAKASTAGTNQRQATGLGRIFRGANATRGSSPDAAGIRTSSARRVALPLCVLAGVLALALAAIPASASKFHLFEETFGSVEQPTFETPRGIAVDQSTGDVLVMDAGTPDSIKRFNADGTPDEFSATGSNVIDGEGSGDETPQGGLAFANGQESQIAVDNSGAETDGDIYVTNSNPDLINIFSEDGEYLGQLTESSAGAFSEACGVAVDGSGSVYVGDYSGGIHRFTPAANPPVNSDSSANFSSVTNPCTLAAGAGATNGFLFAAKYNGPIYKLDSGSGELKYQVSTDNNRTVSVDPETGHVYGATGSNFKEFDASGSGSATQISTTSAGGTMQGIAVKGSSGNVYVSRSGNSNVEVYGPALTFPDVTTGAATSVGKTTATLNGSVNPDGVAITECEFEWGETISYGKTAACVPNAAGIGSGASPVAVHADLSGLEVGTTYRFRLRAANANGPIVGGQGSLLTAGPVIEAGWAEDIVYSEARLKAQINPKGSATTYRFEWGTDTSYGSQTPEATVGSDGSVHTVTALLNGLSPGTTYHYRAVATNADATNQGPDETFTVFEPLGPATSCPNQTFRDGPSLVLPDCRAYEMVSPIDKNGSDISWSNNFGSAPSALNQSSVDGDKFTYSSLKAFGDAVSAPYSSQYIASRAVDGWSTHAISPPSKGGQAFLALIDREYKAFSADLSIGWLIPESSLQLAPGAAAGNINIYRRDNQTGAYQTVSRGEATVSFAYERVTMDFQGFSRDGEHAIFASPDRLTPDAPSIGSSTQVYEWDNGEVKLVSILPNGEPYLGESSAGFAKPESEGRKGQLFHAISDDGSRVFWTTIGDGSSRRIYARIDGSETRLVAGSEGGDFVAASASGDRVVFTIGDTQGGNASLYVTNVDSGAVTPVASSVFGVSGTSDDASQIYFVSGDTLASGAVPGDHNLYSYRDGSVSLVATLSHTDLNPVNFEISAAADRPIFRDTAVTPDGHGLVFMSNRRLTGHDNTYSDTGAALSEVYRYDSDSERLTCVSCNPSGARPTGFHGYPESPFDEADELPVAAWIPTWQTQVYSQHVISNDGNRVFFSSFDALVPSDTNGVQDAYQWEADGSGTCGKPDGCISLLSSGSSPVPSEFIDASANGDDVFIRTQGSLLPQDPGLYDIYDARVGGGFPQAEVAPECAGDSCQSAPEPPREATPASAGFHGAGNPRSPLAARCGARARQAAKLSHRAKRLHRRASHARADRRRRALHRRAARLAARSKHLRTKANRCRRASRRARR